MERFNFLSSFSSVSFACVIDNEYSIVDIKYGKFVVLKVKLYLGKTIFIHSEAITYVWELNSYISLELPSRNFNFLYTSCVRRFFDLSYFRILELHDVDLTKIWSIVVRWVIARSAVSQPYYDELYTNVCSNEIKLSLRSVPNITKLFANFAKYGYIHFLLIFPLKWTGIIDKCVPILEILHIKMT